MTISEGVTSIGNLAFYDCGLSSVTIPSSVTSMGEEAFGGDCALTSVTSLNKNPNDINTLAFEKDDYYNSTLYVPKGTIDIYKSKEGWKLFAFIEEIQ